MASLLRFFTFFASKLRLSNPWNFKVPALLAIPYFLLYLGSLDNIQAYLGVLCSYCTIIGMAGVAYLSNDFGDREKDQLAGKENALIGLSNSAIVGLAALFISMALLPWLWFPITFWTIPLIAAEIALFLLYSLPPLRLKESPLLGPLVDALYAHALPAALAFVTFKELARSDYYDLEVFFYALLAWQFILGLRNILIHQIKDEESDRASGTRTFATAFGPKTARVAMHLFLAIEVLLFALVAFLIDQTLPYFLAFLGLRTLWLIFQPSTRQAFGSDWPMRDLAYRFLDDFYILWLPVFILVGMIFHSSEIAPILIAHLVLFKNGPRIVFNKIWHHVKAIWASLFSFHNFLEGMWKQLVIFATYTAVFVVIYFSLEANVSADRPKYLQEFSSRGLLIMIGLHLSLLIWKRREATRAMLLNFFPGKGFRSNLALLRIAIISKNRDKYSETFIHNHVQLIQGEVHFMFGDYLPTHASVDRGKTKIALNGSLDGYLKNNQVQVVLAEYGPSGVAMMPICEKLGIPLVVHFHGYDAFREDVLSSYGKSYPELFQQAAAVVAVSEHMRVQLERLGCVSQKIKVLHYGISIDLFQRTLPLNLQHLVFCGRFVEKKAPQLVLKAFGEIQRSYPETQLTMIGDGPLLEECKALALQLKLNRVEFRGALNQDDVVKALDQAGVLLNHSVSTNEQDSEGMPLVLMEAMAMAMPVIATNHAGIPELITHQENGLLVYEGNWQDTAGFAKSLLKDPAFAQRLAKNARESVVKNHSLQQSIDKLHEILFECT